MSEQFCHVVGCGKHIALDEDEPVWYCIAHRDQQSQLDEPEHDYQDKADENVPLALQVGQWIGAAIALVGLACTVGVLGLIVLLGIKLAGSIW